MPHSLPDQPVLTPAQRSLVQQHLPGGAESPLVVVVPASSGRQTAWWILTVLIAVLATALLTRSDARFLPDAWAQTASPLPGGVGARGIYAFTGQLTAKTYGLFMMDVDSGTIWCYELEHGPNGEPQMKLVAARSWIYDRFLEEFNVADPVPSAVKMLVQQQRAGQAVPGGGGAANTPVAGPTVNPGGEPVLPAPGGR
jgi:hypothetical protein